jgi:hypothetical protein
VNRAGRWSAAARQAYLLRSQLIQPLFTDGVVRADRHGVWALATLTALLSGDWLNAREPTSQALCG